MPPTPAGSLAYALTEDPVVIVRFLGHLGLPTDIPEAQLARAPPTGVSPDLLFAEDPA